MPSRHLRSAGWALIVAVAVLAAAALVVRGYESGSLPLFYGALLALAAVAGPVVYWIGRERWPPGALIGGMCVAIFVLLAIGAELATRAFERVRTRAAIGRNYSYEEARKNPGAFLDFWDRHVEQATMIPFAMPDPTGRNPYVPKPGWRGKMHESEVRINQLGFRGPEITIEKGDRFRIVALGESSTFGVTMWPDDRPWPEVLEERIQRELTCDVPVQVINGGVPGWTLENNLLRLEKDVLPLNPDLLLSYHGYNGFPYLLAGVRGIPFLPPPSVPPRPSLLLERAEKVWRLNDLRRRYRSRVDRSALSADVSKLRYRKLYDELIEVARARGIEVALSTFNMAVNHESPQDVVDFYGETFPEVESAILANRLHTRILEEMPEQPGVHVIDASSGIDGNYDLFVDLVHFNQAGRDRLADQMLGGIRDILIHHPRLHCRPRHEAAQRNDGSSRGDEH